MDNGDLFGPTASAPLRSASEPLWGLHDSSHASAIDFDPSFLDLDVMDTVLDFGSFDTVDLSQLHNDGDTSLIFAM
jgi:hypothetical protein